MKSFDEYIKDKKAEAKTDYHSKLSNIDKNYGIYYMAWIIASRWNDQFPDSKQPATANNDLVCIYLGKDQNVAKDFMLFLEEQTAMIKNKFPDPYKSSNDSSSVDLIWTTFNPYFTLRIWVYYGGSNCSRKLIRTEQRVVEDPIYEVVCND